MTSYFHKDQNLYFDFQRRNAEEHVIPFIEEGLELKEGMLALEIGCGEGGVLKAFTDRGLEGYGVELSEYRYSIASGCLAAELEAGRIHLVCKDIYDTDLEGRKFDIIILKDVIEHIVDQKKLLLRLKPSLTTSGKIYLGFPPWQMPFGGHQQILKSRVLSRLPYFHMLPMGMYKLLLRLFGTEKGAIESVSEIKRTGLSIEHFERLMKESGYRVKRRRFYLINPIYEEKYGLKPRRQAWVLSHIPWLRNFVTTCAYYLIEPV